VGEDEIDGELPEPMGWLGEDAPPNGRGNVAKVISDDFKWSLGDMPRNVLGEDVVVANARVIKNFNSP